MMLNEQRITNRILREHLIACLWVGAMATLIFLAIVFDWKV